LKYNFAPDKASKQQLSFGWCPAEYKENSSSLERRRQEAAENCSRSVEKRPLVRHEKISTTTQNHTTHTQLSSYGWTTD
jgi:hypothetical protein